MSKRKKKGFLNALKLNHSSHWFRFADRTGKKVREILPEGAGDWLNFQDMDDGSAEIRIYGEITPVAWFDDDVSAAEIYEQLKDTTADTIHVRINSPGGSVFDGVAIYNLLKESSAEIIVHIDGAAASIAGVIAMAGDEIIIGRGATFMAHDPWTWTAGDAGELRQQADILDTLKKGLVDVFVHRTGIPREEIENILSEETWLTGADAVEMGFADRVADDEKTPEDHIADSIKTIRKNNLQEEPEPAPEPGKFARLSVMQRRVALNERLMNQ